MKATPIAEAMIMLNETKVPVKKILLIPLPKAANPERKTVYKDMRMPMGSLLDSMIIRLREEKHNEEP